MTENARAPLLISVPEAARLLSIGRNTAYDLIAAGTLPSIKLGRRRLVSVIALEAWIARQCGRIGDPAAEVVSLTPEEQKE